jgi:CubicO group peptidase (beta-lactamase class C family)
MKYRIYLIIALILISNLAFGQDLNFGKRIDSLINAKTKKPFNGSILIAKGQENVYSRKIGYSDIQNKTEFKENDQFVIGSISKQFTAVLVLREYEKKGIDLFVPIKKYLPELSQGWADTVNVHHLLTHMHGIRKLDGPTVFRAGTKYEYSQIGYDLLAKIVEKTSGKTFEAISKELFFECGMLNTCHPNLNLHKNLVKGYTEQENGEIQFEHGSLTSYVAAGGFISTIEDLKIWNNCFYNGKLLEKETMKMVTTKQNGAIRNHPVFGITEYGYGITIDTKGDILQYGQTGFAPGFISMNFYFPETKTSVIVLMNISYNENNLKETFLYHSEILKIFRECELKPEWTLSGNNEPNNSYTDIAYFHNKFVAIGANGRIDRITKSGERFSIDSSCNYSLNGVCANDEIILIAGNHGTILYSTDGEKFRKIETATHTNLFGITSKNGLFIAGSENGTILSSKNGLEWTHLNTGAKGNIISISANSTFFIGVTDAGEIIKSSDGINWEIKDYNKEYEGYNKYSIFKNILATQKSIVIVGIHDDGTPSILFSSLGNVWTEKDPIYHNDDGSMLYLTKEPNGITYDPDRDQYIISCDNGELFILPGCTKCNKLLKISDKNLNALLYIDDNLYIVGEKSSVYIQKL